MSTEIQMNMLRKRAKGIPRVTKSDLERIDMDNISIMNEFLQTKSSTLSPQSIKQYRSALQIWFRWLSEHNKNMKMYEVTNRVWLLYIAWLNSKGLAPNSLRFKKSAVSSLYEYIEENVAPEVDEYSSFKNFTKATGKIPRSNVYEKVALSIDEINHIVDILLEQEDLRVASLVLAAFYSCGRRGELVQIKVSDIYKDDSRGFITTGTIRGKGDGEDGKPVNLKLPTVALDVMKQYVETRDFESEYVFANSSTGEALQADWCTNACSDKVTPIAGRRVNPHLLRGSGGTYMLEQGVDIKMVSKLLNHEEIGVTSAFYDLRTFDDEFEDMFASITKKKEDK